MALSENEIWEHVKSLIGRTLLTYVTDNENTIIEVKDTGSPKDEVIIRERSTYPIREDIVKACQILEGNKSLCRSFDLYWLAGPEKKTSSIVFRIVGEIYGDRAKLIKRRPETLILE